MVLIEAWDSFQEQAQALYKAHPLRTRFVVKYRHSDAALSVRVTDDDRCIKFVTSEAADLRLVEKLQAWFATEAVSGAGAAAATPASAEEAATAIERKRRRNAELARSRAAKASLSKSPSSLEGSAGKTLTALKREQAKRAKKAASWARRQERKLLRTAASVSAAAAGGAGAGKK